MKLSEIMNTKWKDYSISTVSDRAIPSVVDGFKPVHRFLLLSGYENCKNSFMKVNGVGSVVAKYGYEHGEQSACDALSKMGQYFSNNLPIFKGSGNFGNKLNQQYSSARYIFCKLQSYIDDLYKDTEFAPDNDDPEILTKQYYLPVIPMVLVNGINGLATGYTVNIAPHDPLSIIDTLLAMCDKKEYIPIKPRYYDFTGDVKQTKDGYELHGVIEQKNSYQFIVKDLPVTFHDSESFEKHLRKLLEKGTISSYENNSVDDKFLYEVNYKRGSSPSMDKVINDLRIVFQDKQVLTTIMPDNKLKIWNDVNDIVKWFYEFRIPFIQKRINAKLEYLKTLIAYYTGLSKFIEDVITGSIILKNKTEEEFKTLLLNDYLIPDQYVEKVMNTPVRSFSKNKIAELTKKLKDAKSEYSYYKKTTKEEEYKKDLNILKDDIIKYWKEEQ